MKVKLQFIIIFFTLGIYSAFSQNNLLKKAEKEFDAKNYSEAVKIYERIINDTKDISSVDSLYKKVGIGYNEMNQYNSAIKYLQKHAEIHPNDDTTRYELGQLYLKTGNIKKAKSLFIELQDESFDNEEYKRMVDCCHFALSELSKPNKPPIKNEELINSPQSEFGMAFFEDNLIFASHKINDNYSTISGRIDQGYADIFSATYDSLVQMYNHAEKLKGKINSSYNDGTFTHNAESNIAYFAQCRKNPDLCRIFKTHYENGKWIDVVPLKLGDSKYNYAHPSLTTDGKTLYFASDIPGGLGGRDIWKVEISSDGIPGNPINVGNSVNTNKDEMFPFIVGDSILLFSSEGHIGMGGLDIFYSKIENGLYDRPINVGAPINSTSDDFSILVNKNLKGGFFCSNRNNEIKSDDIFAFFHNLFLKDIYGKSLDSLTFNPIDDVKITYSTDKKDLNFVYTDSVGKFYMSNTAHASCNQKHTLAFEKEGYFTKEVVVPCYAEDELIVFMDDGAGRRHLLTGNIHNRQSGEPLEGALVTVKSLRGQNESTTTDIEGNFVFKTIRPDDFIVLRSSKNKFLSDSRILKTPDNKKEIEMSIKNGYETDFALIPIEFDIEFEIENIYYEYDNARLSPASEFALNKLVNLLRENPQIRIRINSHADERGNETYNLDLSNRRSASVVNYLVKSGISRSRLLSRGFGESLPLIKNAKTETEHQKNRRTTFEIMGEINVAATGSGALYDIPGSPITPDSELFKRIREANEKGEFLTNEYLLNLKIKTDSGKEENATQKESVSPLKEFNKEQIPLQNKIYRVQIIAIGKEIDLKSQYPEISNLLENNPVHVVHLNDLYKYQLGDFKELVNAEDLKLQLAKKGFTDCFIVIIEE